MKWSRSVGIEEDYDNLSRMLGVVSQHHHHPWFTFFMEGTLTGENVLAWVPVAKVQSQMSFMQRDKWNKATYNPQKYPILMAVARDILHNPI